MAITGGFGFEFDILSGASRRWYMGRDGVRRFVHNDQPCDLPGFTPEAGFDSPDQPDSPEAQS